jgi:peroxiredoxin
VHSQIVDAGASLFAISPQLPERSRTLIEKRRYPFEILRDPGNEVGASFGLRFTLPEDLKSLYLQFGIDLAEGNGEDSWTLCLPGRYIIDGKGLVRYAQTDPDYTRRPEPEETLDALLKLSV